ncbi:ABC transporter ATP-binding protein [Saccharopolyspora sp. WRP15-2]|uniref:ABC transporter ATP-binding protein n=1 Tax=Saccharopolyspora oryzae TaxID=2997343 RepID=A0ABT4URT6_9PSEU|nr:ABC transporter ATP-binding protein [Saccharopolyspora oryzae]MDA3624425.1 ABC transporter ATP-binding protein [Saccharopolyspora oryzae]
MGRIRLERLGRRFGAVAAVDGMDLEIEHGDFLALLGPSGCGKTTLLRMIAGLLPPSEGRILVDGEDVTDLPPKRRDLAMVFQSYALYPHLTVASNIGFPLRIRRRPRAEVRERVAAVAAQLELGGLLDRRPKELSGGQRQRVALARALVRDPKAFLMDEPLSNLDAKLRTATRVELAALHRRLGSTFIYVTHDQVEAMTMATRIALINGGRLEQVGTPAEVYDQPESVFVAGFLGAPPMNLLSARVAAGDERVRVTAPGLDVPLWRGTTPEQEVVLGIRPEHLSFAALTEEPGERPLLRGVVRAVENLGSEEVAICDVGGTDVAVRGPRPLGVVAGEAVALTADPHRIHLFDEPTGRRLVWQDDPVPVSAS